MSIIKVATSGTTVYYVDKENKRFLRVKSEGDLRNLWYDGSWNRYITDTEVTVGESLRFILATPDGAYQISTPVTSITEVEDKDIPEPVTSPIAPDFYEEMMKNGRGNRVSNW